MTYLHLNTRRAYYTVRAAQNSDGERTGRYWVAFADQPEDPPRNNPATAETFTTSADACHAYDFVDWQPATATDPHITHAGWG